MSAPYDQGLPSFNHSADKYVYENLPKKSVYPPKNKRQNLGSIPNREPDSPEQLQRPSCMSSTYEDNSTIDQIEDTKEEINKFSEESIRRGFIRKVSLLLAFQLLLTWTVVILFTTCEQIKDFLQKYDWFYWIGVAIFFVIYIILLIFKNGRKTVPYNYICLLIFTASFAFMLGSIAGYYDTYVVFIAIGITIIVSVGIAVFCLQEKIKFRYRSGVLLALALVVLFLAIAVGLTYAISGPDNFKVDVLQSVIGGVFAVVFSLFLVIDIKKLVDDGNKKISKEDYVSAVIQLYMDVVEIFSCLINSCRDD